MDKNEKDDNRPTGTPPHLLRFIAIEHEQCLVSIANGHEILAIHGHVHDLYLPALTVTAVAEEDIIFLQLLSFVHFHFLHGNASLLRCHLSEGYASARSGIDASLIAATILADPSMQQKYVKREKPFDKLNRHLRNLIKDKKPHHRLIPTLLQKHGVYSAFASHADIDAFMHRVEFSGAPGSMRFEYFQFARDANERFLHMLAMQHVFVLILDVFSDFLRSRKIVDDAWHQRLVYLGQEIERRLLALRPKDAEAFSVPPATSDNGS